MDRYTLEDIGGWCIRRNGQHCISFSWFGFDKKFAQAIVDLLNESLAVKNPKAEALLEEREME